MTEHSQRLAKISRVADLRESGHTQVQVAELLDISVGMVRSYERAAGGQPVKVLPRFCDNCGGLPEQDECLNRFKKGWWCAKCLCPDIGVDTKADSMLGRHTAVLDHS